MDFHSAAPERGGGCDEVAMDESSTASASSAGWGRSSSERGAALLRDLDREAGVIAAALRHSAAPILGLVVVEPVIQELLGPGSSNAVVVAAVLLLLLEKGLRALALAAAMALPRRAILLLLH